MALPSSPAKHYEKNQLDIEIDRFSQLDKPTIADLNRVGVSAQIQQGIDAQKLATFRRKGIKMDEEALKTERHYSRRMALQLTRAGYERPSDRCDAHAIVSGNHRDAARMRAVMAWCKMRIDDHHNGCWLPRDRTDRVHMPAFLKNAVPHRNIHTNEYYDWIASIINFNNIDELTDLVELLKMLRFRLQSGSVPPNIWA